MLFIDQLYEDYLRRLGEARELMINEIRIKKAAGDNDGADSVLDSICRRTIGIPLKIVRSTSPERLLELIRIGGQANFNLIIMAELLLQDGELSEEKGKNSEATISRLQAFCLLIDSMKLLGPEEQAEYREKLDALATNLKSISDAPYLRGKVDSYLSAKTSV